MDWGEGDYERTADVLLPVAERVLDAARLTAGEHVLDIGTGTGNVALGAAKAGARVIAVDPARRLLAAARQRLAGLDVDLREGVASALPVDDASMDVALSVFALIFDPDGSAAADELLRVLRPGGRAVFTSWLPSGPAARSTAALRAAIAEVVGPPPVEPTAWGDPAVVTELFERRGARVSIGRDAVQWRAASPAGYWAEQEQHHPIWIGARRLLSAEVWADVTTRSIVVLTEDNEDPEGFCTTSDYLVIRVEKSGTA